MVEFNINNLLGNRGSAQTGGTNFDALLNLARGQLENISSQVQELINQTNFSNRALLLDALGAKVQLPQLSNLIAGQQNLLLKTAFPIDQNQPFNINVQNTNVTLSQGQPILQLQGQVIQGNAAPQRFTAEIPLQSLAQNPPSTATNQGVQNSDQVIRNFLPNTTINVATDNLSETLRPLLPQNIQNLNLTSQNNFNVQVNSFISPSGEQIIINQPQTAQLQLTPQAQQQLLQTPTGTNPPTTTQNIIQGTVEIFPGANEALIRTDFGTFRATNLTQLPNGSQISFTITSQATPAAQAATNNIFNLNPTNIQALRLSLESPDSPLQNLIRILNSSQAPATVIQRFFPNPEDKSAYARSLMFISGVNKGAPEGWLGDEGQMIINQAHESDTNLNRLSEVFGVMRNFAGHGQQPVNTEWNSYLIPYYDGSKLSFVTLQVQKDPDGKEQQTTKGKRKFILELEQDELGRVAIEGLYSKVEGKVNGLDVVLKTEHAIDDDFRNGITQIYNDTATAYGFSGTLSFAPFTTATPLYTDISKILGDGIVI